MYKRQLQDDATRNLDVDALAIEDLAALDVATPPPLGEYDEKTRLADESYESLSEVEWDLD